MMLLEAPPHCVANLTTLAPLEPSFSHNSTAISSPQNLSSFQDNSSDNFLVDLLVPPPEEVGCYDNLKPEEQAQFLQYEVIVGGYCNCFVGLIGLVGNILSIIVLSQKEMQKNNCFNKLLIGLVTSDSLHILFGIMESFRSSFPSLYPDNLLYIFPWFHYPFYRITLCASIYMVVAVAIERYLAVCFPHDYQGMSGQSNRAWYYILPAIFNAFFFNMPRFFETEARRTTYWKEDCSHKLITEVVPTDLRLNRDYIIIYVNWIWTISTGIIPFVALVILNAKIFIGLKKVRRNLSRHQRLADARQRRENGRVSIGETSRCASTTNANNASRNRSEPSHPESVPLVVINNGNGNNVTIDEEDEGEEEITMATSLGHLTPSSMRSRQGSSQNIQKIEDPTSNTMSNKDSNGNARLIQPATTPAPAPAPASPRHGSGSNRSHRGGTAAQRRMLSAAQSREANMAVILVCTVTMFLICHLPRVFIVIFEASTVHRTLLCRETGYLGIPVWFLYIPPIVRFLQVLNASVNFPIYYLMGNSFRNALHSLIKKH